MRSMLLIVVCSFFSVYIWGECDIPHLNLSYTNFATDGFNILLNNERTAYGGYTSRVTVTPGGSFDVTTAATTTGEGYGSRNDYGVTVSVSVKEEGCDLVSVEYALVNNNANDVTVGICLFGDSIVDNKDNVAWLNSTDYLHGIRTATSPFVIQSEDGFSGTYGGSLGQNQQHCTATAPITNNNGDTGMSVNWNAVQLSPDESKDFRLVFATCEGCYRPTDCSSGNCSNCSSSDDCWLYSTDCYWENLISRCRSFITNPTCTTLTTCGDCKSREECDASTADGCSWDSTEHACNDDPNSCKGGNCLACSSDNCFTNDHCYISGVNCLKADDTPTCGTSSATRECSSCKSRWECLNALSTTCYWDSSTNQCGNEPLTCSDGKCTACSPGECYAYNDRCYVRSGNCVNAETSSSCDPSSPCQRCQSKFECEFITTVSGCFWDSTQRQCELSCSTLPNVKSVGISSPTTSFDILLNGSSTSRSSSGYYVQVTTDGVTVFYPQLNIRTDIRNNMYLTLSVEDEDCDTVSVGFSVENTGGTDRTVNICVFGYTSFSGNSYADYANLLDKHGVYTTDYPFFIQSEEPFTATLGGSIDGSYFATCMYSTSAVIQTGVVSGSAVSWRNAVVPATTTREFRMSFSTRKTIYDSCLGGNCTACDLDNDDCISHGSMCYVNNAGNCDRADVHPTCGTSRTGFACGSCKDQWECAVSMSSAGYTCYWNSLNSLCSSQPVTCADGNCSACTSNCYANTRCYLDNLSNCVNANAKPTCGTSPSNTDCMLCKSQWECLDFMSTVGVSCFGDDVGHRCDSEPITCSDGNCSACAPNCYVDSHCYLDNSGNCVRADTIQSCDTSWPESECSSCLSQYECSSLNGCTWNSGGHTCRGWCPEPHVTYVNPNSQQQSFRVLLNSVETTSSTYSASLSTSTGSLNPTPNGVPSTAQGLRVTYNIREEGCDIVALEVHVENEVVDSTNAVGFCIYGNSNINGDESLSILNNKHGIRATNYPFFIQAEESFSGIYIGDQSQAWRNCLINAEYINPGVADTGFAVNWNGIVLNYGESKDFRIVFSTCGDCYEHASCRTGANCTDCRSKDECWASDTKCYWGDSTKPCKNAILNPSCDPDNLWTECSSCKSRIECDAISGYICDWNSATQTCSIGCADYRAPCSACSKNEQSCHNKASYCYFDYDSSSCLNSSGSNTCPGSTICSSCLSEDDCLNNPLSRCEWSTAPYYCRPLSCLNPAAMCAGCGASRNICFGKGYDCYHDGSSCVNSTDIPSPSCSVSESMCSTCLSQIECDSRIDCVWRTADFTCTQKPLLCKDGGSVCSACISPSTCFGKDEKCYFSDSVCKDSILSPTCTSSSTCGMCMSAKDCINHTPACYWNANSFTCSGNTATPQCSDMTCGSCTQLSSCHARGLTCYWEEGSCKDSSPNGALPNPTCFSSSPCADCHSAYDCTHIGTSCDWNPSTSTCDDSTTYCDGYTCSTCSTENACHHRDTACYWEVGGGCTNSSFNSGSYRCTDVDVCSDCVSQFDCETRGRGCKWDVSTFSCTEQDCLIDSTAGCSACSGSDIECHGKGNSCYLVDSSICVDTSYEPDSTCSFTMPCPKCQSKYDCLERGRFCRWNDEDHSCSTVSCSDRTSNCSVCYASRNACFQKNSVCFFLSSTCKNSSDEATCIGSDTCPQCLSRYDCLTSGTNCKWDLDTHTCRVLTCGDVQAPCSLCASQNVCYGKNSSCYYTSSSTCVDSIDEATCKETDPCSKCMSRYDCISRGTNCQWDLGTYLCGVKPPPPTCADASSSCSLCNASADECYGKSNFCYYRSASHSCFNSSVMKATCTSTEPCLSCLSNYDCTERASNCEWKSISCTEKSKGNKSKGPIPGWGYFLMIGLPIILVVSVIAAVPIIWFVMKKRKVGVGDGIDDNKDLDLNRKELVSHPPNTQIQEGDKKVLVNQDLASFSELNDETSEAASTHDHDTYPKREVCLIHPTSDEDQ